MAITTNNTDCSSAIGGTGSQGCKVDINYINRFMLLEKGTELNLTSDTLDQSKIDDLVQDGKLIILPEHFSFENQSEETVYETTPSGGKIAVRNGRYELVPMYASGVCLGNSLATLSTKQWTLLMIDFDDSGNSRAWGEETSTLFKGFDLSLVYAENRSLNDGSVATKVPLRLQFSTNGTQAMKSRVSYISAADAVDFANLDGVNDVSLTATTTTAADLRINANISCDSTTSILSNTADSNWRIIDTSDSSVQSGYSIAVTSGQYSITGLAAGTYTVEWYDETNSKDIIAVSGSYYDSDTITVTLTS